MNYHLIILTLITFFVSLVFIFSELLHYYIKNIFAKDLTSPKTTKKQMLYKKFLRHFRQKPSILLNKIFNYSRIEKLLQQSGHPGNITFVDFQVLHKIISNGFLIFFVFLLFFSQRLFFDFVIYFFLWLLIIYLPIFWLKIKIEQRIHSFELEFSNFIDMLSLTVNAGANFENALTLNIKNFKGVIYEEFKKLQTELHYGYSLEDALQHLTQRINSDDLKHFSIAVKQAKSLGTPLARILEIQSHLILTNRIQRAEELSRTASVKISFPLVFFIFPALLILYLAPAILQFMNL